MKRLALAALLLPLPAAAADLYRPDGSPDWTRYHDSAEAARLLKDIERRFPDLARVHVIGKSLQGRDLLVLELTNRKLKPAEEKPAYYVDGGVHSTELTGSEVVLYYAWHLATRYGQDPRVTRLLDTRALYLRPKFNPDGSDYVLTHPEAVRSTLRPWDDDEDGTADEDPPEDLDGDGHVTLMRVPSAQGTHQASAADPRILEPRAAGAPGPFYVLVSEGTDQDGDGRFNEDGVGGIDMNRNFPRTWGLPYLQEGAGPYPLSEPETRATIEFLHAHRNVTGIVHNHTAGGFLYRLPSTDPPEAHEPDDLELVRVFGERYTATTGHPVRASYTDARTHRYGTLISWGYFDYGVIGWVPEHWGGFGRDDDGDKKVSEAERLRWNDQELGGAGFAPWKPFDHPQLGRVEIGGWRRKYTQTNPPGKFLEEELRIKVPWMMELAEASPLVRVVHARASAVAPGVFRVEAEIENEGWLPTNLTERARVARLAKPVRARLEGTGVEVVGRAVADLGHVPGARALAGDADSFGGGAPGANRRSTSWVVKAKPGTAVEVVVVSEKGGTDRKAVTLR